MCARRLTSGGTVATSVAVAVALVGAGCAVPSPAPRPWQRTPENLHTSRYGAWTNVELRNGHRISGELLAVGDSAVYLGASPRLHQLPVRCVASLSIADQEAINSPVALVGGVGSASTITHGFFLTLSAPIWIWTATGLSVVAGRAGHHQLLVGTPLTAGATEREPDIGSTAAAADIPSASEPLLARAATFARFPQGLRWDYLRRVSKRETLNQACARMEVP